MSQLYPKTTEREAINAQAEIHHALLLGMQLTVSMECGGEVMEQWMFKLFRRQHEDKFLSSFKKLGLTVSPTPSPARNTTCCRMVSVACRCSTWKRVTKSLGSISVSAVDVCRPDRLRSAHRR